MFILPVYRSRKSNAFQNAMLAAREKLRPLLKIGQSGSSWRGKVKYFHPGGEGPQGSANLSPAWFQQGHDVSASAQRIYFSAAHFESGNGATTSAGFSEL
jgi:hypothetical protein